MPTNSFRTDVAAQAVVIVNPAPACASFPAFTPTPSAQVEAMVDVVSEIVDAYSVDFVERRCSSADRQEVDIDVSMSDFATLVVGSELSDGPPMGSEATVDAVIADSAEQNVRGRVREIDPDSDGDAVDASSEDSSSGDTSSDGSSDDGSSDDELPAMDVDDDSSADYVDYGPSIHQDNGEPSCPRLRVQFRMSLDAAMFTSPEASEKVGPQHSEHATIAILAHNTIDWLRNVVA